jgi:hypothetical protein
MSITSEQSAMTEAPERVATRLALDSGCTGTCGRSATTSAVRRHARPVPVPLTVRG